MATVKIQFDDEAFSRQVSALGSGLVGRAGSQALNKMRSLAVKRTKRNVELATKLPKKAINNRLTIDGQIKEKRFRDWRASPRRLDTGVEVWMRGVPVASIGTARHPEGVTRAKKARLYKGAFRRKGLVLKRRGSSDKLMLPKVGVREQITKNMDRYFSGAVGRRVFLAEWRRVGQREINRRLRGA